MNGFNGDGSPASARLARPARASWVARSASARRSGTPSLRSREDPWGPTGGPERTGRPRIGGLLGCPPTGVRISACRAEMPAVVVCLDTRPILPPGSRRRQRHGYVVGPVARSVPGTDVGPARPGRRCHHWIHSNKEAVMTHGVKTIIIPVRDLAAAKALYGIVLRVE